ncbi:hypothetical protein M8C21_012158, partial [Ambrosia artemisiifolia]
PSSSIETYPKSLFEANEEIHSIPVLRKKERNVWPFRIDTLLSDYKMVDGVDSGGLRFLHFLGGLFGGDVDASTVDSQNSRNTLYHHLSSTNYPLSSFKILKDGLLKGADSRFNCYLWVNTRRYECKFVGMAARFGAKILPFRVVGDDIGELCLLIMCMDVDERFTDVALAWLVALGSSFKLAATLEHELDGYVHLEKYHIL